MYGMLLARWSKHELLWDQHNMYGMSMVLAMDSNHGLVWGQQSNYLKPVVRLSVRSRVTDMLRTSATHVPENIRKFKVCVYFLFFMGIFYKMK